MSKLREWFKRLSCRFGWHSWGGYDIISNDGLSFHARCRWCTYEGLIDSQGNLF